MEHSFNVDFAAKHGMAQAVIYKNITFWVKKNKANHKHFYDGNYWTYNSVKAFAELFPYLTDNQIRREIESLISKGLIKSGNYNTSHYDRTRWFCIVDQDQLATVPNGKGEQANSLIYTDINTDNKPDINFTSAKAVVKTKINWLNILVNDYQISEDIAEQFIQYRKDKKATISKIVLNNLIEQSQILNITLDEAIKTMIINNWAGFKADWVKNQNAKNAGYTKPDTSFAAHQASCERQIANIEKFAPKQQQRPNDNDNDNEIIDGDFKEIL
jgi:hypothetical protein